MKAQKTTLSPDKLCKCCFSRTIMMITHTATATVQNAKITQSTISKTLVLF